MKRALPLAVILATIVAATAVPVVGAPPPQDEAEVESAALSDDPRVSEALDLIEVWLDAELGHDQIPGIAAGIVHDQELIWSRGLGVVDRDSRRPVTPDTLFSICSISKLFTSIAVMQQRDAGALELEDPVSKYLDWFAIQDSYPDAPPVTIEGLLTHSAGLPRESDFPYWSGPDFPFPTREQVRKRIAEQAELYPARTYFQYSNLGMALAGEVVAAVSGTPYGEYARSRILDPLGMSDTYPEIPVEHDRLATGYGALGRDGTRERLAVFRARGIAPAAGYASTVQDLARFASWQFAALEGEADADVLARNTLAEMHRVHWVDPDWDTHWGLGFSVWRDDEKTYVGHGGSCPGFRSNLALQTKEKIAAIALANAMVNPGLWTRRMQQIVAPRIQAAMEDPEGAEQPDPELEKYLGLYRSFWGEAAVIRWEGGLATLYLPTEDPLEAIDELRQVDGPVFRRVRDDDELGEEIRFELDEDGTVLRMWRHSNPMEKVR